MKVKKRQAITFILFLLSQIVLYSPLPSQERFRKIPPIPEPFPTLQLPEIQQTSLYNGLTLWVIPQNKVPIISLKIIVFAGESSSPENLPGLATLTANSISRGVSDFSSSEIEEKIEFIGGNLSTEIHPDYSLFSFSFLEEYFDQALDLLSRMLIEPTFNRREIDSMRTTVYYDLLEKSSDPDFFAKRQLLQTLFKNHAYEKSTFNEDGLKNITQKDITSFFDNHYRPNNTHIVFTGNLNFNTVHRETRRFFNRWQRKEMNHSISPSPEPQENMKVCFIETPEAKDATIYMGNIVMPATDPDIFPLMVINQVLGGTPNSRLFMNLRESKQYAYNAFSEIEFFKSCSVFSIHAKVRPEVVELSILEIFKDIELITNKEIPSFDIEQAKSYLIGNFPLQIETYNDLTSKVAEHKALNLEDEHWNNYYENIMLINSEKVFELAKNLPLMTPVIVVAGNGDIVLNQFGEFIKEVDIFNKKGIYLGTYKFD
ncbi:MAG: pitrilysin family protein [Candidatus Aminicenantes bacterium]|jgi:predicted Zn-dependent peptidase